MSRRRRGPVQAVYKPHRGEQSLWDFPDGLYRLRSPPTGCPRPWAGASSARRSCARTPRSGPGSVQLFVEADYEQHYFTLLEEGGREDELQVFCGSTWWPTTPTARAATSCRPRTGACGASTTGCASTYSTSSAPSSGTSPARRCPVGRRRSRAVVAAGLPDDLAELLSGAEAEAVLARAARLAGVGRLPRTVGDRPPYPWPLV